MTGSRAFRSRRRTGSRPSQSRRRALCRARGDLPPDGLPDRFAACAGQVTGATVRRSCRRTGSDRFGNRSPCACAASDLPRLCRIGSATGTGARVRGRSDLAAGRVTGATVRRSCRRTACRSCRGNLCPIYPPQSERTGNRPPRPATVRPTPATFRRKRAATARRGVPLRRTVCRIGSPRLCRIGSPLMPWRSRRRTVTGATVRRSCRRTGCGSDGLPRSRRTVTGSATGATVRRLPVPWQPCAAFRLAVCLCRIGSDGLRFG